MANYRTSNKWLDRTHPQTLLYATILLYVNAAFWLLEMLQGAYLAGALAVAAVFAGLGLANEKRQGYWLALAVAGLNLVFLLYLLWLFRNFVVISLVINVMFAIALMALLLHPMTRSYQRIWFKSLSRSRR